MRSPDKIMRHVVQCAWRCKHCSTVFGQENVSHYGASLPEAMIKPTWFFASMSLLDHLRDCVKTDMSAQLRVSYGPDFLNHHAIYTWFNVHALVERRVLAEEDPDCD